MTAHEAPPWSPQGTVPVAVQRAPQWPSQAGVVPLRPLGIGEIIDGAITTMRRHWKIQLGLSAAVVSVVSVLQAGALYLLLRDTSALNSPPGGFNSANSASEEASAAANLAQLVTLIVGQLAQMVLVGVLAFVVGQAVLGRDVSAATAWAATRPHLWRLIALAVGVMLGTAVLIGSPVVFALALASGGMSDDGAIGVGVLGVLATAPLTVWLYVRLAVAAPALVLERASLREALRRSAKLVRRSWWRCFGILLLGVVISSVIGSIIQLPFLIPVVITEFDNYGSPGVTFYLCTTIGAAFAGAITYPFTAGVTALLYLDLRMRREALDLTLRRA
ncbi:MAG: glycerophosphoryl diester phosphodiesterase membrane domain-containing protein [Sporichthyaceae bacterium]